MVELLKRIPAIARLNRLVSFTEKLNRNFSNQLANLESCQPMRPWSVDRELCRVVRALKPEIHVSDPQAPTICTVALGRELRAATAPCLRVTREYCARHNYNYFLLTTTPADFPRPYAWAKVCLLFYALDQELKDVMWLDADAVITNMEVKLENFIKSLEQSHKSLLVTQDHNGINSGVFFLKSGRKAKILLNLIWCNRFFISHAWWEQASLMDLMRRHAEVAKEIYIEPECRSFNSRSPERIKDANIAWQPGDFVIHFAGCGRSELAERIGKYVNS